jgi:hypothetical protein
MQELSKLDIEKLKRAARDNRGHAVIGVEAGNWGWNDATFG